MSALATILAILGISVPINGPANSTINSQVRLAYSGSTGMMVSWNTFFQVETPTVFYGREPHALINWATSSVSVTYNTSLTYNNHVKLTGLEPDTLYYYLPEPLLKDNTTDAPYSFRTSRVPGDGTPYTVAVTIDMGTMGPEGLSTSAGNGVSANNVLQPGETNTVQSLIAAVDQFDFIWQPGDMAYGK